MASERYSFSLTTFSPSGKLVQIEYALNAVTAGAASVGIKATNGVVLATEKKQKSILNVEHSTFKVSLIESWFGSYFYKMVSLVCKVFACGRFYLAHLYLIILFLLDRKLLLLCLTTLPWKSAAADIAYCRCISTVSFVFLSEIKVAISVCGLLKDLPRCTGNSPLRESYSDIYASMFRSYSHLSMCVDCPQSTEY